jgi:hypothetical protein
MSNNRTRINSSEIAARVGRALRRAAEDARRTAGMHGLPIYVWEQGRVLAVEPQFDADPRPLSEMTMQVTVQLSDREIEALKVRTGKRSAAAALKAWAACADAKCSIAELRAALKASLKEEGTRKGRRFCSGREAIRWLDP